MSRSFSTVSKPRGLFYWGSLGHTQYSTGLLPLPFSASPHHLRIQQTHKARLCQYFFKGSDGPTNCGSDRNKRVSTAQYLSVSRKMRAMIFKVWTKFQRTIEQASLLRAMSPHQSHWITLFSESNSQTKIDCVSTSSRGLTAPKIAEAG